MSWPADNIPAPLAPHEPIPNFNSPEFYTAMQSMLPQHELPDPFSGMPAPLPNWTPLDAMFPDGIEGFGQKHAYQHTAYQHAAYAPPPRKYTVAPIQPLSPQVELPSVLRGDFGDVKLSPQHALRVSIPMQVHSRMPYTGFAVPTRAPNQMRGKKRSREYVEQRKAKILYDPVYNRTVAVAYACAACHRSKKKCVGGGIGKSCASCARRGCECKPRTDKRAHNVRHRINGPDSITARNSILTGLMKRRAGQSNSIRLPISILHRTSFKAEE